MLLLPLERGDHYAAKAIHCYSLLLVFPLIYPFWNTMLGRPDAHTQKQRNVIIAIILSTAKKRIQALHAGSVSGSAGEAAAGYDLLPQVEPHVSKKLRQRLTRVPV